MTVATVSLNVCVVCEESGTVRDEFEKLGHNAYSCDLLHRPGKHLTGDALEQDLSKFDLLICHPPCTYTCNSSVRWLYSQPMRWAKMEAAVGFIRAMLRLPCPAISVEQPVLHKHALQLIGRRPDQIIHPWQFGHGESKATCLWLKGLPPLNPTRVVDGKVWKMPPSEDRSRRRSVTYKGIATAMAEQWGSYLANRSHRAAA
jgi:hypothetical protein